MKRLETLAMIAHDMGVIFEFLGFVTLIPLLVLVIFGEWDMVVPMASVPLTFVILGLLISRIPRRDYIPQLSVALAAVALIWLAIAVVGSLPFVLGLHMTWTDSIFEAMSGWTDSGITMIRSLDTTPRTLLFYRSFMQWIGGIGVIAFGIAMLSRSSLTQHQLYRSEGRSEALMPNVVSTGRRMWVIYLFLTILFTGLVMLSGIPLWDALNLAMVGISTGGFSIHDAGISFYDNALLEAIMIPVMIAGALPFKMYFLMYRGKAREIFKNSVVRLIAVLSLAGSAIVVLNLYILHTISLFDAVRMGTFCTVSGLTTTGFQNSSLLWLPLPLLVIMLLMLIGGASGSTAGGIKANRIILGYEGLVWWFKRLFVRGSVMVPFKHEGRNIPAKISELELSKNMLIISLYLLTVIVAVILALHLAPTQFEVYQVTFEVISAVANNGMSFGYLTAASPVTVKWLFILVMWIGRLEILPVLILIGGLVRGFDLR